MALISARNQESNLTRYSIRISIVSFAEPFQILEKALGSIDKAIERVGIGQFECIPELVIVDNAGRYCKESSDKNLYIEASKYSHFNLNIIGGHGNIGYGSAHNLSLGDSTEAYHLFLNPDVELSADSLKFGLEYLEDNPRVSMVTPWAIDSFAVKQYLNKRFPTVFDLLIRIFDRLSRKIFLRRYAEYEMHDLSEELPTVGIPLASGCFMLCRNSAVLDVGGFDPEYFLYFEDFDLSMRLSKISKIAYLPDMKIKHLGGNASKKGWLHLYYFVRSGIRFFNCYGWSWFRRKRLT